MQVTLTLIAPGGAILIQRTIDVTEENASSLVGMNAQSMFIEAGRKRVLPFDLTLTVVEGEASDAAGLSRRSASMAAASQRAHGRRR